MRDRENGPSLLDEAPSFTEAKNGGTDVQLVRFGRKTVPSGYTRHSPIDGGWGWWVAVGCFIGGLFTITAVATFGVILPELLIIYSTNTSTISWIPTAILCMSHFCGPIYTVIVARINCRKSIILGGSLLSFGISISYFANSIETLILTYGLLAGFGGGLCHMAFPVILSQYFRKYYGIASGILTSSYAASRLVLTPVMQILLEEYGCRSLFLLAGALTMNTCVGGFLCQPSKWHTYSVRTLATTDTNDPIIVSQDSTQLKPLLLRQDTSGQQSSGTDDCASKEDRCEAIDTIDINQYESNDHEHGESNDVLENNRLNENRDGDQYDAAIVRPPSASPYRDGKWRHRAVDNSIKPEKVAVAPSSGSSTFCLFRAFSSLDFTLFGEPIFYGLVANHVMTITLMLYVPMFLLSFGLEIGLTPMDSAAVVSAASIGDIFGRLGGPLLITALKLRVRYSLMAFSSVNGILILVLAFADSYWYCLTVSIASGFMYGGIVGLNNVLIVQIMGPARLPSVLGLTTCVSGFFIMPIAPFMGWIRDVTGSFRNVYIFLSALQMLHCLLWTMKPLLAKSPKAS